MLKFRQIDLHSLTFHTTFFIKFDEKQKGIKFHMNCKYFDFHEITHTDDMIWTKNIFAWIENALPEKSTS